MLQVAAAVAARREMVQVAFEQMPSGMRRQWFDPASAAELGIKCNPCCGAHHNIVRIGFLREQLADRQAQRMGQALQHLERWRGMAVFNFRQQGFRAAGGGDAKPDQSTAWLPLQHALRSGRTYMFTTSA